jgi:hypothetical protein
MGYAMIASLSFAAGAATPADQSRVELVYEGATNLSSSLSSGPALALGPGGAVYVTWGERGGGLAFSRSVDDGLSFFPPRLLVAEGGGFRHLQQRIAAGGPGEVHLVSAEFDTWWTGLPEVVYLRSVDGGTTFARPVYLSAIDGEGSNEPTIEAGWAVAAAWTELGDVVYIQSVDGGLTFTAPRTLSDPTVQASCPSIALAGPENAYVAWYHAGAMFGSDEGIGFTRSQDGGATFSAPVTLIEQPVKGWCPLLGVDGTGTLHLVWGQGVVGQRRVRYMRSTDEGATWSAPVLLSGAAEDSILTGFTVAPDGTLFASWRYYSDAGLYPCRSITASFDGGLTFSRPAPGQGCSALGARSSSELRIAFPGGGADSQKLFHSRVTVKSADSLHGFHTVTPCRLADTRLTGAPLRAGRTIVLPATGLCGLPAEAEAVAVNVTAAQPSSDGYLQLFPAGTPPPATSTVNFRANVTRANNAVVALGAGGAVAARNGMATGSSHLVLDVSGYFR